MYIHIYTYIYTCMYASIAVALWELHVQAPAPLSRQLVCNLRPRKNLY